MSTWIVIKQTGLLKKPMPLEVILGENLCYGRFDGLRLEPEELGERDFILYHPDHIGRGCVVTWNPREKHEIEIQLPVPMPEDELREVYDAVKRMTEYWHCTLEVDDEKQSPDHFLAGFGDMAQFHLRALTDFAQKVVRGELGPLTLMSAMWPVVMGKAEAQKIAENPRYFGLWLHEVQSVDACFVGPTFYKLGEDIVGKYLLLDNCPGIYPLKPYVPLGCIDPATGKQMQCLTFGAMLALEAQQGLLGELTYAEFLARLAPHKVHRLDAGHILVDALTEQEIRAMLQTDTTP